MIGLAFLFIIIIWILICITITAWTAKKLNFKNQILKVFYVIFMFSFLFVAPIGDEIVAKPFYENMCKKQSKVYKLIPVVRNKEVSGYTNYENINIGTVKIKKRTNTYVWNNQTIVYSIWFYPKGGLISRFMELIGLEHTKAFLFENCQPVDSPHDLGMIVNQKT